MIGSYSNRQKNLFYWTETGLVEGTKFGITNQLRPFPFQEEDLYEAVFRKISPPVCSTRQASQGKIPEKKASIFIEAL